MMEKNNNIYEDMRGLMVVAIATIIAFLIGIAVNVATVQPDVTTDTIYEHYTDTVWQDNVITDTITNDNIIEHYITKVDTVYGKDGSEIALQWAKKTYADTLTSQGDTVSYKAYLSGIEPVVLDSISFKYKKPVITNTNTLTVQVEKARKKRLGDYLFYGFGVSAGYDPFNQRPAIVIGASAGIRL